MDTPRCKQSFDREVNVTDSSIRVVAVCMDYTKNLTQGVAKSTGEDKGRSYDLDRKRDDTSIIDVQSLKDPDYQTAKKQILVYDTGLIQLKWPIQSQNVKFKWEAEGELQLTVPKEPNKNVP